MRLITMILMAAGIPGLAFAHELPESAGQLQQAAHQALSLHHLPALLLVLVIGIALWRVSRRETE